MQTTIYDLPRFIVAEILNYVNIPTRSNFSMTCKKFNIHKPTTQMMASFCMRMRFIIKMLHGSFDLIRTNFNYYRCDICHGYTRMEWANICRYHDMVQCGYCSCTRCDNIQCNKCNRRSYEKCGACKSYMCSFHLKEENITQKKYCNECLPPL